LPLCVNFVDLFFPCYHRQRVGKHDESRPLDLVQVYVHSLGKRKIKCQNARDTRTSYPH
jgi:hypothetical protein